MGIVSDVWKYHGKDIEEEKEEEVQENENENERVNAQEKIYRECSMFIDK